MLIIFWDANKEKSISELYSAAVALYDAGVRSSERIRMICELGLSTREVDVICAIMSTLEK